MSPEIATVAPCACSARWPEQGFSMSGSGLMSVGQRALSANYAALQTTGHNIEGLRFNVAVAGLYELTNGLSAAVQKPAPPQDLAADFKPPPRRQVMASFRERLSEAHPDHACGRATHRAGVRLLEADRLPLP